MSQHTQLVIAVGIAGIVVIAAVAFFVWLLWAIAWDAYDYFMQQRTRARHNRFDGARTTERPAFRDIPGVHR